MATITMQGIADLAGVKRPVVSMWRKRFADSGNPFPAPLDNAKLKFDATEVGQWLRGRLYELRADLSPDGKYLIYFAMNGHWGSRAKGAWTAISRAPYLTAIALFAKGDCWNGGGLFTDRNH